MPGCADTIGRPPGGGCDLPTELFSRPSAFEGSPSGRGRAVQPGAVSAAPGPVGDGARACAKYLGPEESPGEARATRAPACRLLCQRVGEPVSFPSPPTPLPSHRTFRSALGGRGSRSPQAKCATWTCQ